MKPNRLLIVTPEIARLASELLQFQWFLDGGSIEESCDLERIHPEGEIMVLLEELSRGITTVDQCLVEISEPDLYVKVDAIEGLIARLEDNGRLLKKLISWLHRHDLSKRVEKDATALKHDYAYFCKALRRWMDRDTMEAEPAPSEENPGDGAVREITGKWGISG
jgi:hypothetical protein